MYQLPLIVLPVQSVCEKSSMFHFIIELNMNTVLYFEFSLRENESTEWLDTVETLSIRNFSEIFYTERDRKMSGWSRNETCQCVVTL